MHIYSWNVNGLRAVLNKGALQNFLATESPDILCLQEIKCKPAQCDFDFAALGYEIYWNPAEKPGYSGTAILVNKDSKNIILDNKTNFPEEIFAASPREYRIASGGARGEADKNFSGENLPIQNNIFESLLAEGRIAILEFPNFYLVNVYVPNSKPDLSRLKLREQTWDPNFLNLLKDLEKEKPVITCGDFNAAHEEIDLARPKTNHHSAGFTNEERRGITNLISAGFIDTFRILNPDTARYTWWSLWGKARENNVGWRIDYFFISNSLQKNLQTAEIHESVLGSDHCPISIKMEF